MNIFVVAALAACFVAVSAIPMDYGEGSVLDVYVVVAAYAGVDKVMDSSEADKLCEFYGLTGPVTDYEGDIQDVVVLIRAKILAEPKLALRITSPHLLVLAYSDRNGDHEINYKVKQEADIFETITTIKSSELAKWDSNGDGSICIKELNALKGNVLYKVQFLTAAQSVILLIEFDTDLNMRLAGSEVARLRSVVPLTPAEYTKIDEKGDGIDLAEMYTAIRQGLIHNADVLIPAILVIRISDKDHSGGVNSAAEIKFAAGISGETTANITAADTDGDNNTSGTELAAKADGMKKESTMKVCKPNGDYEVPADKIANLSDKLKAVGGLVALAA